MKNIQIELQEIEALALAKLARDNHRAPKQQAAWIVREVLIKEGILETSRAGVKTNTNEQPQPQPGK